MGGNVNALTSIKTATNITPHDSNEFEKCRGILLGVAGDLAFVNEDGTTTIVVGLAAGVWQQMSTTRILATGTTATNICIGY